MKLSRVETKKPPLSPLVASLLTLLSSPTVFSTPTVLPASLTAVLIGTQAWAIPPVPVSIFDGLLAREVLLGTGAGAEVLSRVTSANRSQLTEATLRSFAQRMGWTEFRTISQELSQELRSIEDQFSLFRTSRGKSAQLTAGEALTAEERQFLETAADRRLRSNRVNDLLLETNRFVETAPARPSAPGAANPASGSTATPPAATPRTPAVEPEVPALPNELAPDFLAAQRGFMQRIQTRFRLYRNFVEALRLTEGEWRSLFTASGRAFTPQDWVTIRKFNRLFNVLNEHSRMRLIVRAFSQERPVLYSRLNERTAEQTAQYLEGSLGEQAYLEARQTAARDLKLNTIVNEAEQRMLRAIRRCKELGGGYLDGSNQRSVIDAAEDNLRTYQEQMVRIRAQLTERRAALQNAEGQLPTTPAAERSPIQQRIAELRRQISRGEADLALRQDRELAEIRELKRHYLDFVSSFDSLELFANLRTGRINSEQVNAFDLPDPFIPDAQELAVWRRYYDRALYNSTNALVLNETRAFFSTQVGSTRQFIRNMNEMTGKYFGKKFTESSLGREFLEYNRSIAVTFITRMGRILGISIPSGAAVYQADRLWNYVFGSDSADESPQGNSSPEDTRDSPRPSDRPRPRPTDSPRRPGRNESGPSRRPAPTSASSPSTSSDAPTPIRPGDPDLDIENP